MMSSRIHHLRFGLGRFTTDEEVDFAIDHVKDSGT